MSTTPYAPPRAEARARARGGAFARERRSVAFVVFLIIVTFGLYSSIWYIRRTPFVNGLRSVSKLSPVLPWAMLGCEIGSFVVAFAFPKAGSANIFGMALLVLSLLVRFQVADILRTHFLNRGRFIQVSTLGTFVLGVVYLQWVINFAADDIAQNPRRRKKKKRVSTSPA